MSVFAVHGRQIPLSLLSVVQSGRAAGVLDLQLLFTDASVTPQEAQCYIWSSSTRRIRAMPVLSENLILLLWENLLFEDELFFLLRLCHWCFKFSREQREQQNLVDKVRATIYIEREANRRSPEVSLVPFSASCQTLPHWLGLPSETRLLKI